MKNKKINLLMISKNFAINGISTVIMNYCSYLDREKYNITIFAGSPIDESYIEHCKRLKINFIAAANKDLEKKRYFSELNNVLKKESFEIVHVHGNSSAMGVDLLLAKIHGVKVRIAHSHNSSQMKSTILHKLFNSVFKHTYTHALACSKLAGEWLFKNDFTVLPNAFKVDKFIHSDKIRKDLRKKLNIENEFLIGHIGVFNQQKNQEYIINTFNELSKDHDNFKLILVGHGANLTNIEKMTSKSKYKDKIILYGKSTNPAELYNAMDLFVFPSRFEGLGIVLLEAQINGLPCIASTNVPKEVDVTDNVIFLDINTSNIEEWKQKIIDLSIKKRNRNINLNNKIKFYDIKNNAKTLDEMYTKFLQKRRGKI